MENQQLEWKEIWYDEHLKWICGFANTQGGTLVIGKNDKGETVGVKNAKKLLEDLPNKIRSTMGVVADVNLRNENDLDVIEITVAAYPNAISYRGKYYLRSGSTNQELSGYALDALLLGKYGRTYDSMPLPRIRIGDFWHDSFDIFRKKAVASKRLTIEDVSVTDEELLHFLNLTENDYLLLAAVLVFHQTPQQWCIGAYVKIGYFDNNAEILYQDEINGALAGMADKVVETIFTKYFIGLIRYEGLQRIDDYPMPRNALREAVMNALVHRDYSTGSPIQIRVYDDHVTIANDCRLPEDTTLSGLMNAHKSISINPLIANAIFRSGQIEAWGRGIERIIKLCVADNLPEPEFIITPRTFTICFHIRNNNHKDNTVNEDYIDTEDGIKDGINENGGINGGVNENTPKNGGVNGGINENSPKNGGVNGDVNENIPNEDGIKEGINENTPKNGGVNGGVNGGINENTPKNGGVNFGVNETQQQIITLIAENPNIKAQEMANKMNLTKRKIEYNMKTLKDKGLIKRVGSDKTGHWQIIIENSE